MQYISLRDVLLTTIETGTMVTMKAGEPREVPTPLEAVAVREGCVPYNEEVHGHLRAPEQQELPLEPTEKPHAFVQPDSVVLNASAKMDAEPEQAQLDQAQLELELESVQANKINAMVDVIDQLKAEGLIKAISGRPRKALVDERLEGRFEPVTKEEITTAMNRIRAR